MKKHKDKSKDADATIEETYQQESELEMAEASGAHEEELDFLDEMVDAQLLAGRLDECLKPNEDDLSR